MKKNYYNLDSWRSKRASHLPFYKNQAELVSVENKLRSFPPLVSPLEILELREGLKKASEGKAFVLQGGDCAETFKDFSTDYVSSTFRELLTMSIILSFSSKREVIRVGRFAGQFAKPRSEDCETINGVTLPTYRGDMINGSDFTFESRDPDPKRMIDSYFQSAATLNYLRAFSRGKYLDIDEVFKSIIQRLTISEDLSNKELILEKAKRSLDIIKASGDGKNGIPMKSKLIDFYTSHEALLLNYEESLTRNYQDGFYCSSAHLLWLGERTRRLDGAHVEFLKGLINPIGIKCGPNTDIDALKKIIGILNPENEVGKIIIIPRMGNSKIENVLPKIIHEIKREGFSYSLVSDPMHGNTVKTSQGIKTRFLKDVFNELKLFFEICKGSNQVAGGIHLEMTGKHVTECILNDEHINELLSCYETNCDPRLNGVQAVELAYKLSEMI